MHLSLKIIYSTDSPKASSSIIISRWPYKSLLGKNPNICRESKKNLHCKLHPHPSHLLQPLDLILFRKLKREWVQACEESHFKRYDFSPLYTYRYSSVIVKRKFINKFYDWLGYNSCKLFY